jgi:hypothetical protein
MREEWLPQLACYANNDGEFSRPPATFDIDQVSTKRGQALNSQLTVPTFIKKRGELR